MSTPGNLFSSAVLLPVVFLLHAECSHVDAQTSGGPEGISQTAPNTTPTPDATPTPVIDQCPEEGTKYDAQSNTCKDCVFEVRTFRESVIVDPNTGATYGRVDASDHWQTATFGREDNIIGIGTPDNTPAFNRIQSFVDYVLDYCYTPASDRSNEDPNDPYARRGFTAQSSQCGAYYMFEEFSKDVSQPDGWNTPNDPTYSYVFDPPVGTRFWFEDIKKIWTLENGQLVERATPHGVMYGENVHSGWASYFDKDGNRLNPQDLIDFNSDQSNIWRDRRPSLRTDIDKIVCYSWEARGVASPVSLLLPGCDLRELEPTSVKFPLDPSQPDSFVEWHGSRCMPLLAVDPEKKGRITDASQLFGNWTNGGGLDYHGKKKAWPHGFKAMAAYDRNGDGALKDGEIDEIYVWSDINQNGISDNGELTTARDFGIKTLAFKAPKAFPNGDLFIERGYSVETKGETQQGLLIDWHGKIAPTQEQLTSILPRNFPPRDYKSRQSATHKCAFDTKTIQGAWRWYMAEDLKKTTRGYLTLDADGFGKFRGNSIALSGAKKKNTRLALSMSSWPLVANKNEDGYELSIPSAQGSVLSEVSVAKDGKSMLGKTRSTSGRGESYSYSWRAERVGCH